MISESAPAVIHLVDETLSPERWMYVSWLREVADAPVVFRGRRHVPAGWTGVRRAAGFYVAYRAALRRRIAEVGVATLHAWSPRAARFALDLLRGSAPDIGAALRVVLDCECGVEYRRLFGAYAPAFGDDRVAVVARSEMARRALLRSGAPSAATLVISPAVDFACLARTDRTTARRALGLAPEDAVVLVLPSDVAERRVVRAIWGALVAKIVRPEVRIVLADRGRCVGPAARFAGAGGQRGAVVRAGSRVPLPELLRAADAALTLSESPDSAGEIAWSMAARVPVIARATLSSTEWLTHGANARLCTTDEPREVARRLLETLEQSTATAALVQSAHGHAFEQFSKQEFLTSYGRLYASAGRASPARSYAR